MLIVTRIWLGAALLLIAAAVWLAPALVYVVMERPLTALVGWIGENGGAWGLAAFGLGLPIAAYTAAWKLHRREQGRQFAADRTIHVEKPREMGGAEKAFLVVAGGALWVGVMGLIVQAVIVTVR